MRPMLHCEQRITKLAIHIPCGRTPAVPLEGARWRSFPDEDSPEKWEGCDVSRETGSVHHLLQRNGRWHEPLVMARMQGLPFGQQRTRVGMGLSAVGARPPQPYE